MNLYERAIFDYLKERVNFSDESIDVTMAGTRYLLGRGETLTSFTAISDNLEISFSTVKKYLRQMREDKILDFQVKPGGIWVKML